MIPVTSAANCFVVTMNEMQPVYRVSPIDSSIDGTGVSMSVSINPYGGMVENVDLTTALKALAKVSRLLPHVKAKLVSGSVVPERGLMAIGNGNTNFVILLGNAVALAPAWVLLENSPLTPAAPGGVTAADIEYVITQRGGGLWGQILDYKG